MDVMERYFWELRRISEHRTAGAEAEIRKLYKKLLKDLQGFVGTEYAEFSNNEGELYYTSLMQKREYARFLEEVTERLDGVTSKITKQIHETAAKTYEMSYKGMCRAIKDSISGDELKAKLSKMSKISAEIIKRGVENPVSGLTLKDTLVAHRQTIVRDIKKTINNGLMNGDRYKTMANKLADSLDGDYKKSIRIVRTEAHRVREGGFCDAALAAHEELAGAGFVQLKTWRSLHDEKVRDEHKHKELDGQTKRVDEKFEYQGMSAMYPGGFEVARMDINCRCYTSYKTMDEESYEEKKSLGESLAWNTTPPKK